MNIHQCEYSSVVDSLNKLYCIQTVENYATIKNDE